MVRFLFNRLSVHCRMCIRKSWSTWILIQSFFVGASWNESHVFFEHQWLYILKTLNYQCIQKNICTFICKFKNLKIRVSVNPPVVEELECYPNLWSCPVLWPSLSLEITTILNFLFIIPLHFNTYIFWFLPYVCAYKFFMDFKIAVSFKKVNSEYCF